MKRRSSLANQLTVAVLSLAMVAPALAVGGKGRESATPLKPLTENQKILHVLNRLGFGARPGDVERVKAMGLQKYIDQQLDPASIDDSAANAKVAGLEVPQMTTAELFAKYPNPGALLRQLDGNPKKAAAQQDPAMPAAPAGPQTQAADQAAADEAKRDRQQRLRELYAKYDLKPAGQIIPQVTANRVLRAVYSERQLQEVMVDFWQNHFNVFSGKAAVRWYIPSYERDVLRKYALGNFKDLLTATAEHPAMLFYLDNFQSMSPNSQPAKGKANGGQNARIQQILANGGDIPPRLRERIKQRNSITDAQLDQRIEQMRSMKTQPAKPVQQKRAARGINENYARELMELHTLGVDGGYTQQDIIEVAKCFTGWTIADPTGYRKAAAADIKGNEDMRLQRIQRAPGVPDDVDSGQFYFNPKWHEDGVKTVLGQKIDEGGMKDGLKVIDILVNSPATAKFIAQKLAVKFVSDNPSPELVARVADAFHRSGGDIKTTLRAIFTSKEFFAPENYRAKIKSPFELAISSIRTIGADTNGGPAMMGMLSKLGEVPYGYQAPTGYPDKNEDWVNTGALIERLNFAIAIASNRIPGTRVDLRQYSSGDKTKTLDLAIDNILDGDISPATRASLVKQLDQPLPEVKPAAEPDETMVAETPAAGKKRGARQARLLEPSGDPEAFKVVSLVLGSPEFQRQ